MAASANVRVPFTAAQWQEMERQTMILKHMMTSAPVPPEVLLPITKSLPAVLPAQSNSYISLPSSTFFVWPHFHPSLY